MHIEQSSYLRPVHVRMLIDQIEQALDRAIGVARGLEAPLAGVHSSLRFAGRQVAVTAKFRRHGLYADPPGKEWSGSRRARRNPKRLQFPRHVGAQVGDLAIAGRVPCGRTQNPHEVRDGDALRGGSKGLIDVACLLGCWFAVLVRPRVDVNDTELLAGFRVVPPLPDRK